MPRTLRVDVGDVAPAGVRELVVDVFEPDAIGARPVVCCCVPGGGMSRGYFDLQAPTELGNYSMARHLVDLGFVVVTLDPPAVGESDTPDDGYTLTADVVADVERARVRPGAHAVARRASAWASGTRRERCSPSCSRRATARTTRSGCSASAVAVTSSSRSTREERGVARIAQGGIVELTRERFGRPLPRGSTTTSEFLLGGMDVPRGRARRARVGEELSAREWSASRR